MTFKGTFGSSGATVTTLPTSNVRNGDVYIVVEEGLGASNIPGIAAGTSSQLSSDGTRVGDMLIASGTEGSNGYLQTGFSWVYVPSGNDADAAYVYTGEATAATNTLLLKNAIPNTVAQLSLTAGTDVAITSTASGGSLASTISHATYNAVTPVATSNLSDGEASFTAIKELTLSNGHITGITTDTFTPITYTLSGSTVTEGTRFSSSNTSNDVTAAIALTDSGSGTHGTANIKLSSSSITFSRGAADEVVADLVWGTF